MSDLLKQFILQTLEEAKMSTREIQKYSGVAGRDRWDIFLHRISTGDIFTYDPSRGSQQSVIISPTNNSALIAALTNKSSADYVAAFSAGVEALDAATGARVTLHTPYDLFKDAAFGSKDPYLAEKIQVSALQAHLAGLSKVDKHIRVYVGQKGIVPVDGINHIMGTQKEDISLLFGGQEVALVSLKSASTPDEMMQWGGVSYLFKGSGKSQNSEVQSFVARVTSYFKTHSPTNLWRPVSSLVGSEAVYGVGGNVDLVAVSKNLSFVPSRAHGPGVYKFSGRVFYNPKLPTRGWAPVLFAMPSGRNNMGIPGGRAGVYPYGFAAGRGAIKI